MVVEKAIGRIINPLVEVVHHINGTRSDNHLANLMLVSHQEHHRIEKGWEKRDGEWWKRCSRCHQMLIADKDFYRRSYGAPFIGECRDCCKKTSREFTQKHGYQKKTIACVICGKPHEVNVSARTMTCGRKCGLALWHQRLKKNNKQRMYDAWEKRKERSLKWLQ